MKKTLAALFAMCIVFTSALASCGLDEDDEGSTSKKKSSSSSYGAEVEDDEDITEDDEDEEDEDEDDEEDEEDDEEVTTKASKKKKSKDPDEDDEDEDDIEITTKHISVNDDDDDDDDDVDAPDEAIGGDITGDWSFEKNGHFYWISFLKKGQADIHMSASEIMHFTKDGSLYLSGMELPKETVSNDGKTIKVELTPELKELYDEKETSILVLKRKDGSDKSTLDGEYTLEGGMFGDALISGFAESFTDISDIDVTATIKGEEFTINIENVFSFSTKGTTLKINGASALLDDIDDGNCEYSVSGDSLFLYRKRDNKPVELKRVK